jgi:phage shock protein A
MSTSERTIADMKAVQTKCQQTIERLDEKHKSAEDTLAEMRAVMNRWDSQTPSMTL